MSADDTELLTAALTRLFEDRSGPEDRQNAEQAGWAGACWNALADAGLAWVGVPEVAGGSGGTLADAATLVRLAGRHAVALPVAECALLGGWLLAAAGLSRPAVLLTDTAAASTDPLSDGTASNEAVTVAVPAAGDNLTVDAAGRCHGRLGRVPWGGRVAAVVAIADSGRGPQVVRVDPARVEVRGGHNVAGEPRDTLILDGVALPASDMAPARPDLAWELALRGALSRALLIAGAAAAISALTVAYATSRRQFGKPIAAFQAVAGRLVQLQSETEMAALSAEVATLRFAAVGTGAAFEVAAAKTTASRAGTEVAKHAHQVHGAIGMTQEYPLHHFTRRLWSWRQEWGSERHWAQMVGRQAVEAGTERLWPLVTTGGTAA